MEGNQNGSGTGGTVNSGVNGSNSGTIGPKMDNAGVNNSGVARPNATGVVSKTTSAGVAPGVGSPLVNSGQTQPTWNQPNNSGVYNSGMVNAPIASGSSDIIINNDSKKSKKWWIIGIVCAVALVVIVFVIIKAVGGFGTRATNLRSAFNNYANYFLTGEAKDEDIPALETEAIETTPEDVMDWDIVVKSDAEEIVEEIENGEVIGEESDGTETTTYFYSNIIGGEDSPKYRENIRKYFDDFYSYYIAVTKDDEYATTLMDDYKNSFELILAYYSNDSLDRGKMISLYMEGGEDAVNSRIDEISNSFVDIKPISGLNMMTLIKSYGQSELKLIKKSEAMGCLSGNEIDYDCVENHYDDEYDQQLEEASEYESDIFNLLDNAETDLYIGIYSFATIAYDQDYGIEEKEEEDESEL